MKPQDLLEIVGIFLAVVGAGLGVAAAALVSVSLALAVAGVFCLFAAVLLVYLANSSSPEPGDKP